MTLETAQGQLDNHLGTSRAAAKSPTSFEGCAVLWHHRATPASCKVPPCSSLDSGSCGEKAVVPTQARSLTQGLCPGPPGHRRRPLGWASGWKLGSWQREGETPLLGPFWAISTSAVKGATFILSADGTQEQMSLLMPQLPCTVLVKVGAPVTHIRKSASAKAEIKRLSTVKGSHLFT